MNNNHTDEAALLAGGKGVFAKTSYISFGTKDKPEDFTRRPGNRDSYKGKQMYTQPAHSGRTPDTYFEKKHLWVAENLPYRDRLKYQDSQPAKKKGFLTSDFSRRDEFSMTFRTEQYRTQLKQEDKFAKKALEVLGGADNAGHEGQMQMTATLSPAPDRNKDVFLYDLVYEKPERLPKDEERFKLARDTENPVSFTRDRNLGAYRTAHTMAFQPPKEFDKPEYARKPLIRDTFFRKTNHWGFPVAASS
jgi:hypothetical protein